MNLSQIQYSVTVARALSPRSKFPSVVVFLAACLAVALGLQTATAREIHVATTGSDANLGGEASPFLTIGKAASVAQAGDTVIVHAGTYREWIKPARGGTGEDQRITYRAAAGEEVLVKGSHRVTSWTDEGGGVWKVELPNELFGDYNPYALNLSGGWLEYGQWHHRGDVYLDGEALLEAQTPQEVALRKGTWHGQPGLPTTVIRANFGQAKPNDALTEINVRPCVFFPAKTGLNYVTVDGLQLMHSAENWQPPGLETQMGTIGPRGGKYWLIQNCRVTNARCVGIVLGHAAGVNYDDIEAFGDHVIRNNIIRRCGEAGIGGQKGATRCLIEGNLIEDTNYRREFGGWETAAIKFHQSVDTVIRNNLIRRVPYLSHGAFGIWMDWANQGTRITGNIIYDTGTANIFVEMNHGAILIDNNVLIGRGIQSNSEGDIFAHNLFVDCKFDMGSDTGRQSEYFLPHTRKVVQRKVGVPQDDKWFNNLFVGRGLDAVKTATGYAANHNVFLGGARKSTFGDEHSAVAAAEADVTRTETPLGVTIEFSLSEPLPAVVPWVDASLVGVLPTLGQTIEDRYGKPITVDTDLTGAKRTQAIPGPLAELKPGRNRIAWAMKNSAVNLQSGAMVFRTDFEAPAERGPWSQAPQARWVNEGPEHGMALCVQVSTAERSPTVMVRRSLDLAAYRGMQLYFTCKAKGENVSQPPESYNGVKFMLHFQSPSLGARWHNVSQVHGTFDWKELSFVAPIPEDAEQGELDLGLQNSAGTVWFDDILVVVARGLAPRRPAPMANPPAPFKGHNLSRLRGVMSPNTYRDEDLRVLGQEWRANLIRWQITRNWGKPNTDRDLTEYDRWIATELADLDQALAACRRYGLRVVVDLHSPPGGRYEDNSVRMFHEAVYQEHFVKLWESIARRYRGIPAIWGYDLINEPVQGKPSPPGVADWLGTQVKAARSIRAVDPDTPIIIEAEDWDSPAGFRYLTPVEVPRVVYQVHMYWPHSFTHQGVSGARTGVMYPGVIDGRPCDQAALRRYLQPVREFQLAYNVHIYCGEFSAIRWAPGAATYLKDCIELFEDYGWDWSYHAYREWDGWSVEHGPDPNNHQPTIDPTDRKKLLLEWFAKNQKPGPED